MKSTLFAKRNISFATNWIPLWSNLSRIFPSPYIKYLPALALALLVFGSYRLFFIIRTKSGSLPTSLCNRDAFFFIVRNWFLKLLIFVCELLLSFFTLMGSFSLSESVFFFFFPGLSPSSCSSLSSSLASFETTMKPAEVEILFERGRCTRLSTNFLFPLLLILLW